MPRKLLFSHAVSSVDSIFADEHWIETNRKSMIIVLAANGDNITEQSALFVYKPPLRATEIFPEEPICNVSLSQRLICGSSDPRLFKLDGLDATLLPYAFAWFETKFSFSSRMPRKFIPNLDVSSVVQEPSDGLESVKMAPPAPVNYESQNDLFCLTINYFQTSYWHVLT